MSNARMTHYQTLLLNRNRVEFAPPAILNLATLLPNSGKEVLHTCQEILAEETGTRQDLQDQPLGGPGLLTWYTDGSSYIIDSKRMAGAAVVDDDRIIWASGLPMGTSAQQAELIALTQALKMAESKRLNVYTDSRYAFATAHIHGAIYRQRRLLTSARKDVKNKQEILDLLEAIHKPKEVAIIHCPGHQKDDSPIARRNRRADQAAKQAAQGMNILPLQVCPEATHIKSFQYTTEDLVCINKLKFKNFSPQEIYKSEEEKVVLPQREVLSLGSCAERGVGLHQRSLSARGPLSASPVPGERPHLREKAPDRKPRATVERTFHRPPDYSHSCENRWHLFLDTCFTSKEGTPVGLGLASNSD
ncbi:uncharacterized protein LOC130679289 [Manis pentadactyla]|uniref:uncharacterized protein LOC130679289 n=1 Tax=Manis pentadactyla TaxID=143292 RepID=UPI00255D0BC0|nr:uncharacterized protein LOC130679289 [Manis pentadactyla]